MYSTPEVMVRGWAGAETGAAGAAAAAGSSCCGGCGVDVGTEIAVSEGVLLTTGVGRGGVMFFFTTATVFGVAGCGVGGVGSGAFSGVMKLAKISFGMACAA